MSITLEELGMLMIAYRKKLDLNQEELASLIGISKSLVQSLETSKDHNFTLDTIKRAAQTIDLPQITLQFTEPTTEIKIKTKYIHKITSKLYFEDIRVIKLMSETIDLDIEKAIQILRSVDTDSLTRE